MTDHVEPSGTDSRPPGFLNRIHQSNKQYLPQWLGVPAHIHHVAYRMANPPVERPNSRREFQQLLQALEISEGAIEDRFGYGFKVCLLYTSETNKPEKLPSFKTFRALRNQTGV